MTHQRVGGISRREFLAGLTLAGTAGLLGLHAGMVVAEPPPETTELRLLKETGRICWAPQYVAEDLLKAEGFTDLTYVDFPGGPVSEFLAPAKADLSLHFVGPNIIGLDQGDPVVFLAGVHVGCFEVIATERVRRITDLKGKAAGVSSLRGAEHVFIASIAAHVGLSPQKDISWAVNPPDESIRLLSAGKIDAFLGFPPVPQELRAKQIGHILVNSAVDRPWSQYFCCLLIGNRDFVQRHPVATKRALRAILKAADLCAQDPERAARLLVDRKSTPRFDYALQAMQEIPYNRWREYDPEDTVRFYALRLHEAGMIKSSPQKIIAEGTDWRFLNELKRELKG
ncbi:MAG TPA: ABC transporter substrate-binding protein [Candidatus Tectomicrobia bacterium]|nr:ABC transporter substrate-binding protein [Candidatus Tectomicrobia bacterium]